jgi:hypothetical protein
MNRRIKASLITSTMLLWVASATAATTLPPTHGYYTATPGVECTTTANGWAVLWLHDFDMAYRIIRSGDEQAFITMQEEDRLLVTKPGVPVMIESRDGVRLDVRLKGTTVTLWMPVSAVECPVASTANPNAATK